MVRGQAVPLQPMEVNGGAETPLQPVKDARVEQVAGPRKGRGSVGEPTLEQSTEDRSVWKGLELEKIVGPDRGWRRALSCAGARHRGPGRAGRGGHPRQGGGPGQSWGASGRGSAAPGRLEAMVRGDMWGL